MLKQQKVGAVVCYACKGLVSVNSSSCIHCGVKNPGLWGYARTVQQLGSDLGFTAIVTWVCIGIYLFTLLIDLRGIGNGEGFDFLRPSAESLFYAGATGSIPIFQEGRWWTFLSAGWLHGGLLHIAFNLLWIRKLAPSVASAYGAARLTVIYTVSTISAGLMNSWVS